jgi:hypothetical protein
MSAERGERRIKPSDRNLEIKKPSRNPQLTKRTMSLSEDNYEKDKNIGLVDIDKTKTVLSLASFTAKDFGDLSDWNASVTTGSKDNSQNTARSSQAGSQNGASGGGKGEKNVDKGLKVIIENFGKAFVIGGGEKKVRFYPKKVPLETPEEAMARDKENR